MSCRSINDAAVGKHYLACYVIISPVFLSNVTKHFLFKGARFFSSKIYLGREITLKEFLAFVKLMTIINVTYTAVACVRFC